MNTLISVLLSVTGIVLGVGGQVPQDMSLVFDLSTHNGYIVSQKQVLDKFDILSGQKRVVTYIGLTYYAETPVKEWYIENIESKADKMTFGESGRFARLFDTVEGTNYGIHPYKYFDKEIEAGNQYVSMGCVLVSEDTMDKIQLILENQKKIEVVTTFDVSEYIEKGLN